MKMEKKKGVYRFRPPSSTLLHSTPPRPPLNLNPLRPLQKIQKNPQKTARPRGRAQLGRRHRQPGVLRRPVGRRREVPGPEMADGRARRLRRRADAGVGPRQEVDDPVRSQGLPLRLAQEGAQREQRRGTQGLIERWRFGSGPCSLLHFLKVIQMCHYRFFFCPLSVSRGVFFSFYKYSFLVSFSPSLP